MEDVELLVADQLPEGQRIDYKSVLKVNTKSQKAEVAKDVSGLANGQGGWLLFGVEEDETDEPKPTKVVPFRVGDLLTRLENILDSALEPVPKFEAATLDAGDGRGVVVLHVDKSSGRPVMVQGYGQNRYYLRSGTRTRPMSANEVADAHAAATVQSERVLSRLQDLPLVSNPASPGGMMTLDDLTPTPVVATIVAAIDGPSEVVPRSNIGQRAFQENREGCRRSKPLRRGGHWTINSFGLIEEERLAPPPNPPRNPMSIVGTFPSVDENDDRLKTHRLAIYRTGVVEWIRRYRRAIPSRALVDDVHDALLFSARALDEVGYVGRLMVWVRIDHAEEAELGLSQDFDIHPARPGVETIEFPTELTSDRLLADPMPVVRDAMDAVWQAFGIERCLLFKADGSFAG
jgi:hypothetical protein